MRNHVIIWFIIGAPVLVHMLLTMKGRDSSNPSVVDVEQYVKDCLAYFVYYVYLSRIYKQRYG